MKEFKQAYRIETILPLIGPWGKVIDGDYIRMGGLRLFIFKYFGVKCVGCGLEGSFWRKERDDFSQRFYLSLYAVTETGDIVLMTKDHIKPLSKGGKNFAGNLQVMCAPCNHKKSDAWVNMPIRSPYGLGRGHCHWEFAAKGLAVAQTLPTSEQIKKRRERYIKSCRQRAYQRYLNLQKKKAMQPSFTKRLLKWLWEWKFSLVLFSLLAAATPVAANAPTTVQVNGVGTNAQGNVDGTSTNLNITGTGITRSHVAGAGGVTTINFTGLETTQGNTNASNITIETNRALAAESALSSSLSTTNSTLSGLQSTVSSVIQPQVSSLQGSVSTLNSTVSTVQSTLSSTQGQVSSLGSNVSSLNSQVGFQSSQIGSLQSQASSNSANISAVSANVTSEATTRAAADVTLQNQINTVSSVNSAVVGTVNSHTASIAQQSQQLQQHDARISDVEDRVSRQEEAKMILGTTLRLYDGKRFVFETFNDYDARHGSNFATGVRVTLKVGKSYEQRKIEQLEEQLSKMAFVLAAIQNPAVRQTIVVHEVFDDKGNLKRIKVGNDDVRAHELIDRALEEDGMFLDYDGAALTLKKRIK